MCCRRLAGNTERKNSPKIRHLRTIAHIYRAIYIYSQWRHVSVVSDIAIFVLKRDVKLQLTNQGMYRQSEKKLVKQQYLLQMFPQYGELRPTSGWDRFVSLGHPSKFQRISRLGFVTAATSLNGSQLKFARSLAVSWAGTLYIHFRRLLPPNRILPGAILTLRPSLAFSYIGSVTARHSSCGRQLNLAAWYKEWNCGTVAEGATYIRQGSHHVGHRLTF